MAEETDSSEKQHEPSQKKLDEARRKGEVPKSVDITTAATYAGQIVAMLAFGMAMVQGAGATMTTFIERPDRLAPVWFGGGGLYGSGTLFADIGWALAPWFMVPAVAALVAILAQRAFVVAPQKLEPKLNRISPISNLKNKFGAAGLFEFFKSFVKLSVYSVVLGLFIYRNLDEILALVHFDASATLYSLSWLTIEFLAIVLVIAGSLGAIDYVFQYNNHMRKQRMTRKELTDETKQTEGDPHLKQERRRRAYDIATNKMLADVPDADVIVVNPTHYAVALKWSRAPGTAPKCVAKGVDQIAARIREIAAENGIPIHRDPATARALFATVDIGAEVEPDHYQAVAAAIRFAESVRAKARRTSWTTR